MSKHYVFSDPEDGNAIPPQVQVRDENLPERLAEAQLRTLIGGFVTGDVQPLPADPADLSAALDRGNHTGTQLASTISDFVETAQDAFAALVKQGNGVTVVYDDEANTLTFAAIGGVFDAEAARDTFGNALVGLGHISVLVDDEGNTITFSTTATQNRPDAELLARGNHTGEQEMSTVTGLGEALAGKAAAQHTHAAGAIEGLQEFVDAAIPPPTTGGGGSFNSLWLGASDPVPDGTPASTLVYRTGVAAPTPVPEAVAFAAPAGDGNVVTKAQNSGLTVTIAKPANLAVGDLLVAVLGNQTATQIAFPWIAPSGWTQISLDTAGTSPDGYRATALMVYPVTDAAALAALPAELSFSLQAAVGSARTTTGVFRITGANLAAPLAGRSGWRQTGNVASVNSLPMTLTKQPALRLVVHGSQNAAGSGQPTHSVAGMVKLFEEGTGAASSNTTLAVFIDEMATLDAAAVTVASTGTPPSMGVMQLAIAKAGV